MGRNELAQFCSDPAKQGGCHQSATHVINGVQRLEHHCALCRESEPQSTFTVHVPPHILSKWLLSSLRHQSSRTARHWDVLLVQQGKWPGRWCDANACSVKHTG